MHLGLYEKYMLKPMVSVVIPTYNRKDLLKEAIDSVLAQDYSNLEIIVADNASTDGTKELIEEYSVTHSNIVYFRHNENIGQVENGKFAYKKARGDYYFFLCDDDSMVGQTFFSHAVDTMEANKTIVITHAISLIYNERTKRYRSLRIDSPLVEHGFMNYIKCSSVIVGFFMLIRKSVLDESGILMYDTYYHDFWIFHILSIYGKIAFLPEICGIYREHLDSDTNSAKHLDHLENIVDTGIYFMEKVKDKLPSSCKNHDIVKHPYKIGIICMKHFCHLYKNEYGKKALFKALWNNSLRKIHPEAWIFLMENLIEPGLRNRLRKIFSTIIIFLLGCLGNLVKRLPNIEFKRS